MVYGVPRHQVGCSFRQVGEQILALVIREHVIFGIPYFSLGEPFPIEGNSFHFIPKLFHVLCSCPESQFRIAAKVFVCNVFSDIFSVFQSGFNSKLVHFLAHGCKYLLIKRTLVCQYVDIEVYQGIDGGLHLG